METPGFIQVLRQQAQRLGRQGPNGLSIDQLQRANASVKALALKEEMHIMSDKQKKAMIEMVKKTVAKAIELRDPAAPGRGVLFHTDGISLFLIAEGYGESVTREDNSTFQSAWPAIQAALDAGVIYRARVSIKGGPLLALEPFVAPKTRRAQQTSRKSEALATAMHAG